MIRGELSYRLSLSLAMQDSMMIRLDINISWPRAGHESLENSLHDTKVKNKNFKLSYTTQASQDE